MHAIFNERQLELLDTTKFSARIFVIILYTKEIKAKYCSHSVGHGALRLNEGQLHSFLNSALDVNECSISHFVRFTPGGRVHVTH
jgi:hypothetical protein